jgi:spore maturation protein CgeB
MWLASEVTGYNKLMQRNASTGYTILAPGFAKWRGSDGRALAQAFRRLGYNLIEIDEEDYVPWRWQGVISRSLRRLLSPVWISDYNRAVLEQATSSAYDFVLVFKGNLLKPETVKRLNEQGKPVFNFYPDVSFQDHGPNIPGALRWYDCVFTTKSYHGKREKQEFSIRDLQYVRHGFDPEVHRPVTVTLEVAKRYECDVSFVGCWSPEKEEKLLYLLRELPKVSVKTFGLGWKYASSEFRQRMGANLRPGAFGDELSIVYSSSKVNLGLLSSSKSDPNLQDQTTARTFQIPAAGGFLLHEDTAEVRKFFEDGEEVLLFSDMEDMVDKIKLALKTPLLRESIREQGYRRCMREPYDYSVAAEKVLRYFECETAQSRRSQRGYSAAAPV